MFRYYIVKTISKYHVEYLMFDCVLNMIIFFKKILVENK